jgi:hypothetical protein
MTLVALGLVSGSEAGAEMSNPKSHRRVVTRNSGSVTYQCNPPARASGVGTPSVVASRRRKGLMVGCAF